MNNAILAEIDTINSYLKKAKGLNAMTIMILLKERSFLFNRLDN